MIVLHVARARTDSINIRGSLGKTRGRALDYQRYFPLFFRMQCPHPFHSLSRFRCVDFPLSLFLSLPFIPVVSRRVAFLSWFSLACSFLCSPFLFSTWYARALYCEFSLPFAHILVSIRDSLLFSGTDGDSSLPDSVSAPKCYPPSRNGNCTGACETELPDNPLICSVITRHRRSSPISCRRARRIAQVVPSRIAKCHADK